MMKIITKCICAGALVSTLTGCFIGERLLNPYHEDPSPNALLGDRNDHALMGSSSGEEKARAAFNATATYQKTHEAPPYNPVIQPAVVRLMWIPDHLNKSGDLVPAHFYYLKVLKDRWAVTDAFELESQLGSKAYDGSSIPYVTEAAR